MKTIGELISSLLEEKDMNQKELAQKTNVSEVTISRYINGTRQPKSDILSKIADVLDVSIDYLLGNSTFKKTSLSNNDEKDIAKKLDELRDTLESQSGLLFSGDAMDDETREFLLASLERTIRQSKVLAKEKFTPNKYKK